MTGWNIGRSVKRDSILRVALLQDRTFLAPSDYQREIARIIGSQQATAGQSHASPRVLWLIGRRSANPLKDQNPVRP